jgi:endonuclease III
MNTNQKVLIINELLEDRYKSPRHHNKLNPLNELLFVMLSTRTSEALYNKTYKDFKMKYPCWIDVYKDSADNIASIIYPCGLSNQKAIRLKKILDKIMDDFGSLSLKYVKHYSGEELESYLSNLPGVGLKIARCIMMYSFGRDVLPVDTHTRRISQRLGFINVNKYEKMIHKILDETIPQHLRYSYHVNCVSHGRLVCKAINPNCTQCIIRKYCEYHN